MSDIVERLRYTAQIRAQHRSDTDPIKAECLEAASEITSLRAEVERLRAALHYYADFHENPNDGPWGIRSDDFGRTARAALSPAVKEGT